MKTVYKYPLPFTSGIVLMPKDAMVVHVSEQNGEPMLWAEVNTEEGLEERYFIIYGTGQNIDSRYGYIGTWMSPPFVWHLYELYSKQIGECSCGSF